MLCSAWGNLSFNHKHNRSALQSRLLLLHELLMKILRGLLKISLHFDLQDKKHHSQIELFP